jgi:hypothetical protein
VTKDELVELVASITPMRITIDERRGRAVTLGRPRVDFAPGRGVRLRGEARMTWDVAGFAVPITLQAWQLMLIPRLTVAGRARTLALEPVVEALDLKRVPGVVDGRIAQALDGVLARVQHRLVWDFARTLSRRLPLPRRVDAELGGTSIDLDVVGATFTVTESELHFCVRIEARARRAENVVDSMKSMH